MTPFPNACRGPRRTARIVFAAVPALGVLLAIGSAVPRPAAAQQPPAMGAPAAAPNPLNLTAAQQNKMKAIQLKYKPAADKLREQMRALAMKADKEMMAMLTPAQKAKLKQLQAAQLQQMRQMQQGGAGGTRP